MPSKKILFLFIACAGAVGLIFFAVYKSSPAIYKSPDVNSVQAILIDKALANTDNTDSDKDGLKDWEETLWKTDRYNPDSDGDNMTDGEEVVTNRDPSVSGAGDISPKTEVEATTELTTPTDNFSRTFFEKYLILKQKGLSAEEMAQFMKEFLESTVYVPISITYNLSDIQISNGQSEEILKAYGNNVGRALKNNIVPSHDQNLALFQKALQEENYKILDGFNPAIQNLGNLAQTMLTIKVPPLLKDAHLTIINSTIGLAQNLKGMRTVGNDALTALNNFAGYQKNYQNLNFAFSVIQQHLFNNGVTFQQSEDGSLLFPTI